jgi:hypothetical protein
MDTGRPRIRISYTGRHTGMPSSWFGKAVMISAAMLFMGIALLFSIVIVAALLAVGVVFAGYLWWRTRALRRQLREQLAAMQARAAAASAAQAAGSARDAGSVIEGEFARMPGNEDSSRPVRGR